MEESGLEKFLPSDRRVDIAYRGTMFSQHIKSMDIYAQEVNKMKSESTSAPVSKKRNFDATHFNAYGLPLGE